MRKKYNHTIYKKISHAERIQAIYLHKIHEVTLLDLAARLGIKYNTLRYIISSYDKSGRTNKKSFNLSARNKLNRMADRDHTSPSVPAS